MKSTSSTRMT